MKILVIDDHDLIREALRGVLKELKRDAVILEAANAAQAMKSISDHSDISLALLDLSLPDADGFSLLEILRQRYPAISVAVLSATQDRANVVRALDLGASGYIPKSAKREVMCSAMQLILAGGIYIPPEVLERGASVATVKRTADREQIELCGAHLGLTKRQIDVLALLMHGMNNKSICRALKLAEPTVKNHVTSILRALKVSNRTEAVIAVNNFKANSSGDDAVDHQSRAR
jgi:DNA-binding NarL/FixJ family response regulator